MRFDDVHMGRSWRGTELEDNCPCPKAPCGLVDSRHIHPDCPQHAIGAAKTMRQIHSSKDCSYTSGSAATEKSQL